MRPKGEEKYEKEAIRKKKKKIGKALVNNLPLIGNIFSWLLLQRYFVNFIE